MTFLNSFFDSLWMLLLDTGFWLIAGLIFAGVVHVLIPRAWLTKQLGGRGVVPIMKASLLGIPLPLCSCSVIPVAAGLREGGASKGASAAFAISTPQTGEESIPLTWALFGPVFALTRPVIAILTAFTAGMVIDKVAGENDGATQRRSGEGKDKGEEAKASCCSSEPVKMSVAKSCCSEATAPEPEPAKSCCSSRAPEPKPAPKPAPEPTKSCCSSGAAAPAPKQASSCCAHGSEQVSENRRSAATSLKEVFRYAFVTMLRDLAPWLAIGLLLSALIGAAVPPHWIEEHVGTGILPMLLMLVVGLPLYICATSSTPLAYTLVVAGLSPGAALVLLLAGPASNMATMAWILKDLGKRALVVYLVVIAVFAVACGWAFDTFLKSAVTLAEQGHAHEHSAIGVVAIGGAIVFSLLLLWALGARYGSRLFASKNEHAHHHEVGASGHSA